EGTSGGQVSRNAVLGLEIVRLVVTAEFHIEALALASFQIGHRFAFFSDLVRFISGVMIQRSWAIKLSSNVYLFAYPAPEAAIIASISGASLFGISAAWLICTYLNVF